MPILGSTGTDSAKGFGFTQGAAAIPVYPEDVFAVNYWSGNSSTQTITSNIDLTTLYGGLVWIKAYGGTSGTASNLWFDTLRGATKYISSNTTSAEVTDATTLTGFTTSGFTLGASTAVNQTGTTYLAWTFQRRQKFFDIVTYTGNGVNGRTIAHNLGATPALAVSKSLGSITNWNCYSTSASGNFELNTNAGAGGSYGYITSANSTTFTVSNNSDINANGTSYVVYLWASNAGGFGPTMTENGITVGTVTTNSTGVGSVTSLSSEPQMLLIKNISTGSYAFLQDSLQGMPVTANSSTSQGGRSSVGQAQANSGFPIAYSTARGFTTIANIAQNSVTYLYMTIASPMKVPAAGGTTVFARSAQNDNTAFTTGFPVDLVMESNRSGGGGIALVTDRTRWTNSLSTSNTSAQFSNTAVFLNNTATTFNNAITNAILYAFKKARGTLDIVAYTGTGSNQTIQHNLNAQVGMMIIKPYTTTGAWPVFNYGSGGAWYLLLNSTAGRVNDGTVWNFTAPTNTEFYVGTSTLTNSSGVGYIAYIFAAENTGVMKTNGDFPGFGSQFDFNLGNRPARFVMIKRTDSAAPWYYWDTARGMVAGTDPSLQFNANSAEVNANSVYSISTGYRLLASPAADVNTSGGTYLHLAYT